ncbi:RNA polymerase sigma factor RpoE [Labilithrix luteola]|uniref:RNA polymerase sigma factor RpoE n=1 Tax=Labilithrix luteola TaxID=1391654 RepID=A0A0K1QGI8_9BACT|nr:RNA polymerase sigma factor RpoE [Labilithrix luteola]
MFPSTFSSPTGVDEERDAVRDEPSAFPVPSFDAIYDEHLGFVWHTLRGLGVPPSSLDDAVQDVFVVVHRRLPSFEARSKITTWLFGIALRVAYAHRRKQRPSDDLSAVQNEIRDERPTPFEETVRSEAATLVERLLDELDDNKRLVFVLMEIEQMSAEEMASLLGIKVNTVYSRLRYARAEFEKLVARYAKGEK